MKEFSSNTTRLFILGCYLPIPMDLIKTILPPVLGAFIVSIGLEAKPESTVVPMDAAHWALTSDESRFEEYLGVPSIYLPGGIAEFKGPDFHNGIIEFDIAFPEGRGFPGILFRVQDDRNSEELYVRPHQSGNPDAIQYTPIFNRTAGWQLYHGDGYGAPVEYRYDAWNHVRIVVRGTNGEVFVNEMEQPLFQIHEFKHGDVEGAIMLKGHAKAHFANFSYQTNEDPEFALQAKPLPELEETAIANYWVSTATEDEAMVERTWLNAEQLPDLKWREAGVESSGVINIAKFVERSEGKNTSLVKFVLSAESKGIKRLDFGYSDQAQAYVNGKLIYSGDNRFRSRDYRYLGTIGYFDSIFLDLKKGDNEIVFAIKEELGGWGLKSRLKNLTGVVVK